MVLIVFNKVCEKGLNCISLRVTVILFSVYIANKQFSFIFRFKLNSFTVKIIRFASTVVSGAIFFSFSVLPVKAA
jgi:hypothetical protein